MIYEAWRVIGEDVPRIYYTRIQTYPFENANRYETEKELEDVMSERFSKLLKSSVSVKLSRSCIDGLTVEFSVFYNNICIMEKCGNFIELAPLRDAIFYVKKYSILGYQDDYESDEITQMVKVTMGDADYSVMKYGLKDRATRNFVQINNAFLDRLAIAVSKRWKSNGKV